MSDFLYWLHKNNERITWFIIGIMTGQGLRELAMGDYNNAAISFAIVALNVFLSKRN